MDLNREKAIDLAVSQIERQFGKGAIMKLGEGGVVKDVAVISTGSLGLDIALGIGGVPRGRVIEIYGPEASGKTTLALQIVAEAMKQGGMAAFIDAEHALDLGYAKKLGVKTDDLLVSQPDHGEQALEIGETLVRSGAIDVLVIDSVAALVPKAEIEGEMGDSHMGLQARLMSQALRKLTATIARSHTVVIFINQIRMKIGVMFGNPETTTGGNALKFYASVRMDIRRIGALKDGDNIVGGRTRVKVVKNKMAPPFKEAEFDILYGTGISRDGEIVDLGSEMGIVEKSGAWYSFGGERIGQGREAAKQFLKEHPETADQIMAKVMEKVGLKRPAAEAEAPVADKKEKAKGRQIQKVLIDAENPKIQLQAERRAGRCAATRAPFSRLSAAQRSRSSQPSVAAGLLAHRHRPSGGKTPFAELP
ncbi:MAG: recombinase RecA [Deltaproteobacteria bacterium]|nr:recombinase RecA [Deltaproteobacteria bacterium]